MRHCFSCNEMILRYGNRQEYINTIEAHFEPHFFAFWIKIRFFAQSNWRPKIYNWIHSYDAIKCVSFVSALEVLIEMLRFNLMIFWAALKSIAPSQCCFIRSEHLNHVQLNWRVQQRAIRKFCSGTMLIGTHSQKWNDERSVYTLN